MCRYCGSNPASWRSAVARHDQALAAKMLHRAVDVNGGEAKHVGQLLLRHRKGKTAPVIAFRTKADTEFAEQVCQPLHGRSTAHGQGPFAQDRVFDQAKPGERARDTRMLGGKGQHAIARQLDDPRPHDGADSIVEPIEHQRVQVGDVARNQDRRQLPAPVLRRRVPIGPTFPDDEQRVRAIPLANEVDVGADPPDARYHAGECLMLLRREEAGFRKARA
jgi:hypothetical protein